MKLTLTSITGTALELNDFHSTSVTTTEGIITILPGHEPIISALSPWLLKIQDAHHVYDYIIGWGVVRISSDEVAILADMIEDGGHDLEAIKMRKQETEAKLAELRTKDDAISMELYIELEQEYLKDKAREQFANK
jgi:ATP synthase F1 epsilon subunit